MKNPLLLSIKETMSSERTVAFARANTSSKFGMIPVEVMAAPQLSSAAKIVFAAMRMESYNSGHVAISSAVLGQLSGLCRTRAYECVIELERAGLIIADGTKIKQVQVFRIPIDESSKHKSQASKDPKKRRRKIELGPCAKCGRLCKPNAKTGWCRQCKADTHTRQIVREELGKKAV